MSEKYIPFDLKITKLTGKSWTRSDNSVLAEELLDSQGKDRESIENRVIICFNHSYTSDVTFLIKCEPLILKKLERIVKNPSKYVHRVYGTYQLIVMIQRAEWRQYSEKGTDDDNYNEFDEGKGLRDISKAEWSNELVEKLHQRMGMLILPNPNQKEHGCDFVMLMDVD